MCVAVRDCLPLPGRGRYSSTKLVMIMLMMMIMMIMIIIMMMMMIMIMMMMMTACRYSSTKLVLETLAPSIRDGTLLVLDELLQCNVLSCNTYCSSTMECSAV